MNVLEENGEVKRRKAAEKPRQEEDLAIIRKDGSEKKKVS
jgi:hypothetical protein